MLWECCQCGVSDLLKYVKSFVDGGEIYRMRHVSSSPISTLECLSRVSKNKRVLHREIDTLVECSSATEHKVNPNSFQRPEL
jgi:hypothetical protein